MMLNVGSRSFLDVGQRSVMFVHVCRKPLTLVDCVLDSVMRLVVFFTSA